ncbi:MAG: hypothetical protein H6740_01565 [Alphaproteobacteria bacterium]|nr:hypothetical protein [Alphaproteobacteria bacterium]
MGLSPKARAMLGVITVILYVSIAAVAYESVPWVTALFGVLAAIRGWLLLRQWPRSKKDPSAEA